MALVLALVNGLPERDLVLVVALDVLLLVALWVTDESRRTAPRPGSMRMTLDRAVTDPEAVRGRGARAGCRLEPVGVVVDDVDFVRETTRVAVRVRVDGRLVAVARRPAGRRARRRRAAGGAGAR